ncbi:Gag protein [Phytophthora palmivora]|uniref:Gag protein n=1 Tax=Phytophthora palmivora TaxID=4796 RepID=A0A2P4YBE2_9STRA|nr:Gag protein [Phytophthora palmivora]
MAGIFGGDAIRSLAAATPVEQVERIEAFDTYERGFVAYVHVLRAPVAELKPAQPKMRLKDNPYEGKEEENLHFWVRKVELAMDAALISSSDFVPLSPYQMSGEDLGVHARSDNAGLFHNLGSAVKTTMRQQGRQEAYASEEVMGVADFDEGVAMILATGRETKAHCQACGIATTASSNAESRRAVWTSTVAVPSGTAQAGDTMVRKQQRLLRRALLASCVGNIVPHKVEETKKKNESAICVSSEGNIVPRGVKKTSTRAEVSLITSLKAGAVHLEAPPEVSALLNLEELSMRDFLAELKAGEITMSQGFTKQRATRLGSENLKNPEDPVYSLVNEFSDVVSKHPPS